MFLLRVFGGLSLTTEGPALPSAANQRRRLAFLAILAAHGRGISRERVVGLLWPESPEERAQHALDQILYTTRRDLGRESVLSEAGVLRLNPEVVKSDLAGFEHALEAGDMERAVEHYAGSFLEGIYLGGAPEFERWVEEQRTALERRFVAALGTLAQEAERRGDFSEAAGWRQRQVAIDPYDTGAMLSLLRAMAAAGDREGALRQAHSYAVRIREQLEIEPDGAVVALAEQIRSAPEAFRPDGTRTALPGEASIRAGERAGPDEAARRTIAASEEPTRPRGSAFRIPSGRAALAAGAALLAGLSGIALWADTDRSGPRPAHPAPGGAPEYSRSAPAGHVPAPGARDLYLRGRIAWSRRSREGLNEAVVLFRQATERDPLYAEAYAGLAEAYVMLGYHGYMPGSAAFPKARAAALRAVALDPSSAGAYAALGVEAQWEHRWAEAEEAFARAITYAPENATAHQWYALLLRTLGRGEEAVAHAERAAELDPLSIQVQNTYAITLSAAGMRDSALQVYKRIVVDEPDTAWVRQNPWVLSNYGGIAAAAGRHEQAVRLIERAVQVVPGHPRPLYTLAVAYLEAGDSARARDAFARADTAHPHYPLYRGLMAARWGDLDDAFAWLERVEEWSPVLIMTLTGAKQLQGHPRYEALLRQLGLPPRPPRPLSSSRTRAP